LRKILARALSLGGWLILSGILRSQTPAIYACLAGSGLELLAQEQQEEWVCVIARRAHGKG
jgi:ribosomal protein L11 methylase PrmA